MKILLLGTPACPPWPTHPLVILLTFSFLSDLDKWVSLPQLPFARLLNGDVHGSGPTGQRVLFVARTSVVAHTLAVFFCVCLLLGRSPCRDRLHTGLATEEALGSVCPGKDLSDKPKPYRIWPWSPFCLVPSSHLASRALASGSSVDCPHHETVSFPFLSVLAASSALSPCCILGLSSNGPFLQEGLPDLQAGPHVSGILYPRPVHSGSSQSGDCLAPLLDCDPKEGSTGLSRSPLCHQHRVGSGGVLECFRLEGVRSITTLPG